jgi:DNA polymerase-3 subunit epsilon
VALDVETTGLDPAVARVLEVAALRLDPGGKPESFHALVNPGVPIPPEASAIHGILDRDVRGQPRFEDIGRDLYRVVNGADLVAYKAPFDLAVLAAEFALAGVRFKVKGRAVIDPLTVFRGRSRGPCRTRSSSTSAPSRPAPTRRRPTP